MSVKPASDLRSEAPIGLSPRLLELWLTAVRHRRRADELAARDSGTASL